MFSVGLNSLKRCFFYLFGLIDVITDFKIIMDTFSVLQRQWLSDQQKSRLYSENDHGEMPTGEKGNFFWILYQVLNLIFSYAGNK